MKKKIIVSFILLIMTMYLFSNGLGGIITDFPIDLSIETSQNLVSLGDSIEVNVYAKLIKNHISYKQNCKYVILNQKYSAIHDYIKAGVTPDYLFNNGCTELNEYWQILYSDDDTIIDDDNIEINFNFWVKLIKIPPRSNLSISVSVMRYDRIIEYGMLKDYVTKEGLKRSYKKKIEIKCSEFGLKRVVDNNIDVIEIDNSFKVSDELPEVFEIEFKLPENCLEKQEIKIDSSTKRIKIQKRNFRDPYKVLINTTLELDFSDDYNSLSNVSCDSNIGDATNYGLILVFNSANTSGETGYIYLRLDGQNYIIEIELISSYGIQGYFKYTDYGNNYVEAIGTAMIWNLEDENNPMFIDSYILDSNGCYEFENIQTPNLGLFIFLQDSACVILERGSNDNLIHKGYGIAFPHLEFSNSDEDNVNIHFCINDAPDDYDFNIYRQDMDLCFSFNPYMQQKRAEEFSQNQLLNAPRELLYIFAHQNHEYPNSTVNSYNSWFAPNAIIGNPDNFDLVYICGMNTNQHLLYNSPIQHELSHAQHWHHQGFQINQAGAENGHLWHEHYNEELAWYEGFAHYFSCLIKAETVWEHYDSGYEYHIIQPDYNIDIEFPEQNPQNNDCEGAVCATLWDMYDNYEYGNSDWNNDNYNCSITEIWNAIKCPYEVFTIRDFFSIWFINHYEINDLILDICYSHGIDPNQTDVLDDIFVDQNILYKNHPNPFMLETTIYYSLSGDNYYPKLEVYNVKGQRIKVHNLVSRAGKNSIIWNGQDERNMNVSSGVYFYRLIDKGKVVQNKKMLLIK